MDNYSHSGFIIIFLCLWLWCQLCYRTNGKLSVSGSWSEFPIWQIYKKRPSLGQTLWHQSAHCQRLWHQNAHWNLSTFDKFHMTDIFQHPLKCPKEIVRIVNIIYYFIGQQKLLTQLKELYYIWDYFHRHFGHSYLAKFFALNWSSRVPIIVWLNICQFYQEQVWTALSNLDLNPQK